MDFLKMERRDLEEGGISHPTQSTPSSSQGWRPHPMSILLQEQTCASLFLWIHLAILPTSPEAGAKPSREVGAAEGAVRAVEIGEYDIPK